MNNKQTQNKSTNSATNKAANKTILCKEFKIKNFAISEFDMKISEANKQQFLAYPRYSYDNKINSQSGLTFQTGWIKLEQYGFPTLGDYNKTDETRNYVKIPLNLDLPDSKALYDMATEIDKYILANVATLVPKIYLAKAKFDKLDYNPLIKEPAEVDEGKTPRLHGCKAKLDIDFNTKKIKTCIFVKEVDQLDTTKTRTVKKTVNTPTDLDEYLTWNCNVRFIINANKFYVQKATNPNKKYTYGMSLKIVQMEIEPREKNSSSDFSNYAFKNNDDAETQTQTVPNELDGDAINDNENENYNEEDVEGEYDEEQDE